MAGFINQGIDMQNPEAVQIMRRQQMAQQLLDQSQQPQQGQMVSGHYVAPSWTQQLAKGLQGYLGRKGLEETDQAQQKLAETLRGRRAEELGKFTELLSGKPAQTVQPLTPNDDEGNVNPAINMPAQAGDMGAAYQFAVKSQDPALQQFGMQGLAQMPVMAAQKAAREEDRAFRQQEADATRAARVEQLQLAHQQRMDTLAAQNASRADMMKAQQEFQREMARMTAANRPERQAQIIQTETGPMQLVGGKALPILGPDNKPVTGKSAAGASTATRKQDATDALATIEMADKLIGKATGSGIGNAYDATAAFFGKSTEGAQAAAQLKALEGDLVSKMPKMSGPQSDKDVLLYKQMAGQIGDPSVPPETKKAALKTIKVIQSRYAGVAPEGEWEAPAGGLKFLGFEK